ncbi:flagellar biosynthesis protein FlgA [Nocardioides solisilvae]|uniref:flagellar biosynthesis protein FlgA n=1 Tax=Nocardioides solisilvae TaxID=1542435 RepID=UPI0013A58214|nr:flagellar biosynthesis protein FlgA [Nocardioides solisilvae]
MLTTPPAEDVPVAQRSTRAGWRDPRLWVGVALVGVSVVVGARVVGGADETVPMWGVADDLAEGQEVGPSDLVARRVRFADPSDARRYYATSEELPPARHLLRGVAAGELLPRAALGSPDEGVPHVSVSVPSVQIPPAVGPGSVVDVWMMPPEGAGDGSKARLAVADVRVVEAPRTSGDLGLAGPDRQLVLAVPDDGDTLARVLTASGERRLMLVGRG